MSGTDVADVVPELILLCSAALILVFSLFVPRRAQRWAAALAAVAVAGTALAIALNSPGMARLAFGGTYALDVAAVTAKLIILGIAGAVIALSTDWFGTDPREGEYYTLLLMSTLGAMLMAGSADLMELTVAVLLSSATGYVLSAYHRRSRRSAEAAVKYYLLGALANGVMVYGVVLLFGLAGTTVYTGLAAPLAGAQSLPLVASLGLLLVGLAFKMGAVPAHAWMPDVSDGAPAPVSAFVTAAPKVGALIALARLMLLFPETASGWRPLVAALSAATMTLGNLAALWQDNVRRLLGWSAVSQTGYAIMAVVAIGRSPLAWPALLYFLAAYAVGNITAFGVVVLLRGESARASYAGLARTHPWLAAALVLSFMSFVGIPPLAGFAGKLALFGATVDAGYGWLAVLAALNTVVSLAYYARVLGPVYFGAAPEGDEAGGDVPTTAGRPGDRWRSSIWPALGTGTAAGAVVLLGVGAELLLRLLTGLVNASR